MKMKFTNKQGYKIANTIAAFAAGSAVMAITAGSVQASDLYIDRPMPSYGPGAETAAEVPLIAADECKAPDANSVTECRTVYSNGDEEYRYLKWDGDCLRIFYHWYPHEDIAQPHGGCANWGELPQ